MTLELTGTTEFVKTLNISFLFEEGVIQYVANYDYFRINDNFEITGLTDKYVADKPDILVIPGTTQDGLNNLSMPDFVHPGASSGDGGIMAPFVSNPYSTIIVIKDGIEYLGDFSLSSSVMETIIFESSSPPELSSLACRFSDSLTNIYVPKGSLDAYRSVAALSSFYSIISEI